MYYANGQKISHKCTFVCNCFHHKIYTGIVLHFLNPNWSFFYFMCYTLWQLSRPFKFYRTKLGISKTSRMHCNAFDPKTAYYNMYDARFFPNIDMYIPQMYIKGLFNAYSDSNCTNTSQKSYRNEILHKCVVVNPKLPWMWPIMTLNVTFIIIYFLIGFNMVSNNEKISKIQENWPFDGWDMIISSSLWLNGGHFGFMLITQNAQGWQNVTRQIILI